MKKKNEKIKISFLVPKMLVRELPSCRTWSYAYVHDYHSICHSLLAAVLHFWKKMRIYEKLMENRLGTLFSDSLLFLAIDVVLPLWRTALQGWQGHLKRKRKNSFIKLFSNNKCTFTDLYTPIETCQEMCH